MPGTFVAAPEQVAMATALAFDPAHFAVEFTTSKGILVVEARRSWSPEGVERLLAMVQAGFFDSGVGIFRAVPQFVLQFGIHGDPAQAAQWRAKVIPDDPVVESNKRGFLTFASAGG